ncbi:MAG: hypothetical protein RLY43_233 [Bacteroidota bacterium]|jgi:GH24 family phage-related lysozyme (muramidase)
MTDSSLDLKYYMTYIESHEGRKNNVYYDSKGHKTVGVGHLITDDTYNVGDKISNEDVDYLFIKDINITLIKAKSTFKKFDSYPLYVRAAIIDGFFRGDLSGSPKTIALINNGKWESASGEYLNNKEYCESESAKTGVWKRMLENSYHFSNYAEELS